MFSSLTEIGPFKEKHPCFESTNRTCLYVLFFFLTLRRHSPLLSFTFYFQSSNLIVRPREVLKMSDGESDQSLNSHMKQR